LLWQALRERHSSKMPAPYSQDLRRRIINAYYNKDGSQRQLAKRFQVSLTFVRNLLRHYRQTGTIEPKKHGGGTKTKIDNHGFAVIEQMIQQKPDLIFSELCQLLKEKTGVKVSKSSMYRYVRKLNMSRKKKSISQ
jgi:transposase